MFVLTTGVPIDVVVFLLVTCEHEYACPGSSRRITDATARHLIIFIFPKTLVAVDAELVGASGRECCCWWGRFLFFLWWSVSSMTTTDVSVRTHQG